MKREFSQVRIVLGKSITARVLPLDGGLRAEIYGGARPHIGAISVVEPGGTVTTTEFPGHKEGVVTARWAETFAAAGFSPVVVLAGIHYDGLDPQGIQEVVAATESMLADAMETLQY